MPGLTASPLENDAPAQSFTLGGWIADDYTAELRDALPGIVETAMDAFYKAVADGVTAACGAHTYGDLDPLEQMQAEAILTRLAVSFSQNNANARVQS